jgi:uncharacterized membrane protein
MTRESAAMSHVPYLLPVHVVFAGLWLGCVLTEALFERALLGRGRDAERILARLHKRVDFYVELPALTGVLITGVWMVHTAQPSMLLHTKIALGLLAIVANLYCVWVVLRRERAAQASDWQEFEALDHVQHKVGAVVLLGIVAALGLGIYLYVKAHGV